MPRGARLRRLPFVAALTAVLLAAPGCGERAPRPQAEPELETVEVTAPPDASFDLESDVREKRSAAPRLAGVMPGGYPPDLPAYVPSSLVNFGEAVDGREYVELHTPDSLNAVARGLRSALAGAGWSDGGAEAGGALYVKEGRRVIVRLKDLRPGTAIHVEYRPQ